MVNNYWLDSGRWNDNFGDRGYAGNVLFRDLLEAAVLHQRRHFVRENAIEPALLDHPPCIAARRELRRLENRLRLPKAFAARVCKCYGACKRRLFENLEET